MSIKRKYDVVVYGATGFTGKLVVEHLKSHGDQARWAIAGRSKSKLDALREELDLGDIKTFVADSLDKDALATMCSACKVVISTVGPYSKYGGSILVEVAIETKCHYVDLTGETPWVAKMIAKHEHQAKANKTLIVHSCGNDSLPADLTTFLAASEMQKIVQGPLNIGKVRGAMKITGGGFSGGTFHSMMDVMSDETPESLNALSNPYSLSPVRGTQTTGKFGPRWLYRESGWWGAYWVISSHNIAVVQRTWGLLQQERRQNDKVVSYGPNFDYDEFLVTPDPFSAILLSFFTIIPVFLLFMFSPLRKLAERFGPSPGTGPSKSVRDKSKTTWRTVAHSVDEKHVVASTLTGSGDAGYKLTSIMLAECALALALNWNEIPSMAHNGGFLTPATAFGNVVGRRMEETGFFKFKIESLK